MKDFLLKGIFSIKNQKQKKEYSIAISKNKEFDTPVTGLENANDCAKTDTIKNWA